MLLVALSAGWLLTPSIATLGTVTLLDFGWGCLAGLGLLAIVLWGIDSRFGSRLQLRRDVDQLIHVFENAKPVDLVVISILAGAGEEALFRGLLLFHLSAWWGLLPGVIVTSLLFGFAHCISVSYVVFTTVIGIIMCGLFLAFDNLFVPMVAHTVYDLGALIYVKYFRKRLLGAPQ